MQGTWKISPDCSLNFDKCIIINGNTETPLTGKFYVLLEYLMINRNIVLSHEKLYSALWPDENYTPNNFIEKTTDYISKTRKLIGDLDMKIIENRKGIGYIFNYIETEKKDPITTLISKNLDISSEIAEDRQIDKQSLPEKKDRDGLVERKGIEKYGDKIVRLANLANDGIEGSKEELAREFYPMYDIEKKASIEDLPQILDLYDKADIRVTFSPIDIDKMKKMYEDVILKIEDYYVLVAKDKKDKTVLGTLTAIKCPCLTESCRPFFVLENIIVKKPFDNIMGIEERLVNEAKKIAANNNYSYMIAVSSKRRTDAHNILKNCGFTGSVVGFRTEVNPVEEI